MSAEERRHGRSIIGLLFEVVLISVGVFLGLLANNWHESREQHAKAQEAIRNFVSETQTNLQATQSHLDYHKKLIGELDQFLSSAEPATEERLGREVHFLGVRQVLFEHTAWDLALATQSLSYLPPDLALQISKVYTKQAAFQTLGNGFLSAVYTGTMSGENVRGFVVALRLYLGDANEEEPAMISLYEKIIPQLKAALEPESDRSSPWRIFHSSPMTNH